MHFCQIVLLLWTFCIAVFLFLIFHMGSILIIVLLWTGPQSIANSNEDTTAYKRSERRVWCILSRHHRCILFKCPKKVLRCLWCKVRLTLKKIQLESSYTHFHNVLEKIFFEYAYYIIWAYFCHSSFQASIIKTKSCSDCYSRRSKCVFFCYVRSEHFLDLHFYNSRYKLEIGFLFTFNTITHLVTAMLPSCQVL